MVQTLRGDASFDVWRTKQRSTLERRAVKDHGYARRIRVDRLTSLGRAEVAAQIREERSMAKQECGYGRAAHRAEVHARRAEQVVPAVHASPQRHSRVYVRSDPCTGGYEVVAVDLRPRALAPLAPQPRLALDARPPDRAREAALAERHSGILKESQRLFSKWQPLEPAVSEAASHATAANDAEATRRPGAELVAPRGIKSPAPKFARRGPALAELEIHRRLDRAAEAAKSREEMQQARVQRKRAEVLAVMGDLDRFDARRRDEPAAPAGDAPAGDALTCLSGIVYTALAAKRLSRLPGRPGHRRLAGSASAAG